MRTDTEIFAGSKKTLYLRYMTQTAIPPKQQIDPAGSVKTITISTGDPANVVKKAGNPAASVPDWRTTYADKDGVVRNRPSYPDTSYQTYLKAGGNLLGIGYNSWKDQLVQNYNTAVAAYEDWYNSMPQQMERITQAGLNPNLAYGAASPGSAGDTSMITPSGAAPGEVYAQGAGVISSLFGNLKTIGEAATIINQLPESRFKGRLAKQLDVAAQAGAINTEAGYMSQLNSARVLLGAGTRKATAEAAKSSWEAEQALAEQDMLDYMRHHTVSGDETSFIENSLFGESRRSQAKNTIVEYRKNQKEYDKLFSNDEYWKAVLDKMKADAYISDSEAWRLEQIRNNPYESIEQKILAMEKGIPGFISRFIFLLHTRYKQFFERFK